MLDVRPPRRSCTGVRRALGMSREDEQDLNLEGWSLAIASTVNCLRLKFPISDWRDFLQVLSMLPCLVNVNSF